MTDKTEKKQKARRQRSRVYPRYSLEECIDFIKIVDKLGANDVSQDSLLGELNKKSPNDAVFTGKISSSKQFGLLEGTQKGYSISERGQWILYPVPVKSVEALLAESFKLPSLYLQLIIRFNDKKLPDKRSLGNVLLNDYGIAKNAKDRAAKVFVKSAEYAGVLKDELLQVRELETKDKEEQPTGITPERDVEIPLISSETHKINLSLSGGNVQIVIPKELSKEDKTKLTKIIADLLEL